jgi:hypothetical protein
MPGKGTQVPRNPESEPGNCCFCKFFRRSKSKPQGGLTRSIRAGIAGEVAREKNKVRKRTEALEKVKKQEEALKNPQKKKQKKKKKKKKNNAK